MKKILITAIIASVLLLPNIGLAQGLGGALGNLQNATKNSGLEKDLTTTVSSIITIVLSLVGTIFLVLTVYAGILWMTASGKEDQIEKAGNIIKASVVGLFIVMSAYAITYFVTVGLGGAKPGSGSSEKSGGTGSAYLGAVGCAKKGGECRPADTVNTCGGTNKFSGDKVGMCDTKKVCCELDEEFGNGSPKCKLMGGNCQQSCVSPQKDVGDCVIPGLGNDQECCVSP